MKRLRHTYGFGVHSPSAFSLVKEVVSLPRTYGYYGYWEIEDCDENAKEERNAKLLLRLLVHLGITHVFAPTNLPTVYQKAIMATNISMEVTHLGVTKQSSLNTMLPGFVTPLFFLPYGLADRKLLQQWLEKEEGALLVFSLKREESEALADWIMKHIKSGIVLDGLHRLIALRRPNITPVRYKIL